MSKVYIGMKINFLTVIDGKRYHKDGDYRQGYYLCKCECGNEKLIKDHSISTGKIRDCGCGEFLRRKHIGEIYGTMQVVDAWREEKNNKTVIVTKCKCLNCGFEKMVLASALKTIDNFVCVCGRTSKRRPSIYTKGISKRIAKIWKQMINRCYNETIPSFAYYGEKGIKVCDEWRNSAKCFADWALQNGYNDDLTIDRINVNGNYEPSNCRWITRAEQARNTSRTRNYEWKGKTRTVAEIARLENISQFTVYCRLNKGMTIQEAVRKNE